METLSLALDKSNNRIKTFLSQRVRQSRQWWTPVWRGLVADPESHHRKQMGSSVWLYLYLLAYANRKTGVVRRRLSQIREDTGYPARTVQRHLKRLKDKNYIAADRAGQYLHLRINKWKSFKTLGTDGH